MDIIPPALELDMVVDAGCFGNEGGNSSVDGLKQLLDMFLE